MHILSIAEPLAGQLVSATSPLASSHDAWLNLASNRTLLTESAVRLARVTYFHQSLLTARDPPHFWLVSVALPVLFRTMNRISSLGDRDST